jgi:predicted AAA+ superfamily ATPase
MKRFYEILIQDHFQKYNECIFLSGPRQVGKTTIATNISNEFEFSQYLNWDYLVDRQNILSNSIELLNKRYLVKPLIIFDEIHKYKEWKTYIKGLFDTYNHHFSFLVTGSSRLDIYRKGGDSMMGRYFLYRVHPLSVAELVSNKIITEKEYKLPVKISEDLWENLLKFGGFPKPFLTGEQRFYNRWAMQRMERLFEEDIRDVLKIQEIKKMELLARIIIEMDGGQINYSSLSKMIQVSDQTIKSWLTQLQSFYFCFTIQPWSKNIIRSLIKEPKVYLYDWSLIQDKGKKYENLVASHLLKAVQFWTDFGLGSYELYYLRDKEQREVDFLITKDDKPWLMIKVKSSAKEPLSKNLFHF